MIYEGGRFDPAEELAFNNLRKLQKNEYPGRGLVVGRNVDDTQYIQAYWIMGRSNDSRNRVFKQEEVTGRLFTEAIQPAKVKDPSLIIYNAMREDRGCFVVSNGKQTDDIARAWNTALRFNDSAFYQSVGSQEYEPDAPNFTPRISAICTPRRKYAAEIAIVRKSILGDTERNVYSYEKLQPGYGYAVTTYKGNGSPLPSFRGDPFLLPLHGDIRTIAHTLWDHLNNEHRVSLAVKSISMVDDRSEIYIINKYI